MRRMLCLLAALVIGCNFGNLTYAQETTTVKGTVKNTVSNETVSSVSVVIKGTDEGTYTDDKGNFTLSTKQKFPLTLIFTSIGFESKEMVVSEPNQFVEVSIVPASSLGQEVVVSATRTPARILESPVSIERIGSSSIRSSAAANYYDMVVNLKGVDFVTSSLTFKTPTTHGSVAL